MTLVRLDKLSAENAGHLPTSYWLIGKLAGSIKVGEFICVLRSQRSRQHDDEPEVVKCAGLFTSSVVQSIEDLGNGVRVCRTRNSHWRVTDLPENAVVAAA